MLHYRKYIALASSLFIVGGLGLLAPLVYIEYSQQNAVAHALPQVVSRVKTSASPSVISGKPTRITVPRLQIDLPIADGAYDEKSDTWALTDSQAHYALPTAQPNTDSGNTLIYGHNTTRVFKRLAELQKGDEVVITTENNHTFRYTYQTTKTVDPNDTSIFSYQGKPRLTLQTCSGFWSQNRQFFFFDLADAK